MTWLILSLLALALALLPWVREALRKPVTARTRDHAGGHFIDLPQGRVHYDWHGPVGPNIIVMVHGLSSPAWVFTGLIRGLVMMGYRVLTYDLYGRGYSDRAPGRQTLAFHTAQLETLLDALNLTGPVALFGYSMGGAIAARFAADRPDRVERLILLAPAGIDYCPGKLLRAARNSGLFGSWLWGLFGGTVLRQAARSDAAAPTVIPDLPARIEAELACRGYLPAILSSERHSLGQSLKEAHETIAAMRIPTLAIWGEKDPVIPVSAMGEFARWNRMAHEEVIPGAGHGLAYSNPKAVLDTVREFVRDVPPG